MLIKSDSVLCNVRPLVGLQGQWIKDVSQGYLDRRDSAGVHSWAPSFGKWPGFQVDFAFACLKPDCVEKLLKYPHRTLRRCRGWGNFVRPSVELGLLNKECLIKVLPLTFVSVTEHKAGISSSMMHIYWTCSQHCVFYMLYEHLPKIAA